MARGGIFDQIGGGFARYSTDEIWKVPHFEKMLYDNAQLTSLYCKAWLLTGEKLFADVVKLCIEFVFNELTSNTGVFYTALDADSDGEEGRYYTWKTADFNRILAHYSKLVGEFYGIENQGLWEADKNILLQTSPKAIFAQQHFLSENELEALLEYSRKLLLSERRKNNPPLLDNKVLLNINAMMIKALVEAFLTFDTETYLHSAIKAAQFILDNFTRNEQEYIHCFGQKPATVAAFLDDYAEFGGALLLLYTATGSQSWLIKAQAIAEYMYAHFYNADTGFFGFTSNSEQQGFARKIDVYDGVTPSANSATALFLYKLGWLINNVLYKERGNLMAVEMQKYLMFQPSAYSNWGRLNLMIETEMIVVAAVGSNSAAIVSALWKIFPDHPNVLLCSSLQGDNLPYTSHRYMDGKTNIYICKGNTCELPLTNISEAKELILRLLEDKKINH
jgi:hypothetical protein